ncbi:UNVERIFIED_CONTAM: hypothetical protein HDU68_003835, partial [Siphonaria sp. JEL0065]
MENGSASASSAPNTSTTHPIEQELNHTSFILSSILSLVSSVSHNKASLKRWTKRAQNVTDSTKSFVKIGIQKRTFISEEIQSSVSQLLGLAKNVEAFVTKLGGAKFMYNYINKDTATARISIFNQELSSIGQQLSFAIDIDNKSWAAEDREDRKLDLQELDHTLQHLVDNDYKILNALELKHVEYFEAMEALQKNLSDHVDKALERNLDRIFMERALTCLRRASEVSLPPGTNSAKPTTPPQWVLTSWEIDIGETVAQGGFAEVLKATWLNHTTVAVKRLHMRLETSRMREDFLREVKTWFPLRHPHILPLLGACATAERPFMVMPFMPRGHSLQYLDWCGVHEGMDSVEGKGVKLLYEVSLGLQYLHSRNVVHGDLKAVNILVDEHGSANVADFGFASLKQFSSTRNTTAGSAGRFGGTLRWMSPERLQGGRLAPPVDVYAFAMTCYEILSEGEVPLTSVPDAILYQHIVHSHLRPELPQP